MKYTEDKKLVAEYLTNLKIEVLITISKYTFIDIYNVESEYFFMNPLSNQQLRDLITSIEREYKLKDLGI